MKRLMIVLLALCVSFTVFAGGDSEKPTPGQALDRNAAMQPNSNIKNIIVMIPDGMSYDGVTLARWYKSYNPADGTIDPSVSLALDEIASGLVRTWWSNGEIIGAITDSAPAGTAFGTGVKTTDKFIGVTPASTPAATILEAARLIGKSTGIVATSNVQHATPGAFTAHYNDRSRYDIIGEQQAHNGIDVLLGGGSMYLAPPYRQDSENMLDEMKAMGYQYVTTRDELSAVRSGRLLGLFAPDAMAYEMDRNENAGSEPSLAEMTAKAIDLLSQGKQGFFLMVEGSKVDWAAHANDPVGLISDILAFDDAVKVALGFAKANQNTMILIMSDHGNGGISIGSALTNSSYSSDPIQKFIAPLSKAKLTGEGIAKKLNDDRSNIAAVMEQFYGINDLSNAEMETIRTASAGSMNYAVGPMMNRRAFLGWTTGGHTGEETNLFTYLPGNGRIVGVIDNTDVPKICAGIWGIDLPALTGELYINAESAFKQKGADVAIDTSVRSGGIMTVTKDSAKLEIHENKNFIFKDGHKTEIKSVVVNQNGVFFVPQEVIDMLW